MFSSATSTNKDREEKQAFLDKSAQPKMETQTTKTTATVSQRSDRSNKTSTTVVGSGGSGSNKGRRGPKMSDGTEFDTGPYGWIFSIGYLFFLWGLSIAAAIGMVYFFFYQLDPKYPAYFGDGSFLGDVPRATFDPNPNRFPRKSGAKNMMEFNMYDHDSYLNYLIRYKILLAEYSLDESNKLPKKPRCSEQALTTNTSCAFDIFTGFGDCQLTADNLEHGFGFNKGQPCIMLKINKILGWYPHVSQDSTKKTVEGSDPTPTSNSSDNLTISSSDGVCPSNDLCCSSAGGIQFECRSNDDVKFEYYPKNGIPLCYYPYANQAGYEQPFAMVKLTNITANTEVHIRCAPTWPGLTQLYEGKENEIKFGLKMVKEPVNENE